MNDNRFIMCARETNSSSRILDPDNRFERAYLEHKKERFREPMNYQRHEYERFECLREDTIRRDTQNRFECLRGDYTPNNGITTEKRNTTGTTVYYDTKSSKQYTDIKTSQTITKSTYEYLSPVKPPGLSISPKKKEVLNIQNESQFPSLPGSPNLSKTPKQISLQPLCEEIEFIPLPKQQSLYMNISLSSEKNTHDDSDAEQLYKVVRKISGGSWSERLKYSEQRKSRAESEISCLNYDEDGFPMVKDIESMVNSFS